MGRQLRRDTSDQVLATAAPPHVRSEPLSGRLDRCHIGAVYRPFNVKDHALKSPVLFDLDETLFNRAASVRGFVEHQFSERDLGSGLIASR